MAMLTPINPTRQRSLTGGQVATRVDALDFNALGQLLPNPDPILRASGRAIAVYREIARDSHVGACIRRRKAAVKGLQWGIDRGQAAARVHSAVQDMIEALDMEAAIGHMLEAPQFGYAPMEIDWRASARGVFAADLVALPPEWFGFDADCQLRFKTRQAPTMGELLPERKFLCPRQDATYQNPYGLSDLALCYWPTIFMRGGKKFWLNFAEKFGSAFLIGKLPRGTLPAEQAALLNELVNLVQSGVAVIPDDGSVAPLEAVGKTASADLYERLVLHCRGEISIVQTGTNQTVEASANKASAHAGMDVAGDLRDADAGIVAAAVNQLIRWTVDINWPGQAAPTFSLWDQTSRDEVQARRDKSNYEAGARFTKQFWVDNYHYKPTDLADSAPPPAAGMLAPGQTQAAATPALAFAQGVLGAAAADAQADPTAAEQAALASAAAPAWGSLLDQVGALVDAAKTPDELSQALTLAYAQLDAGVLVKLMAAAFALAELKGMAAVADEAAGAAGA